MSRHAELHQHLSWMKAEEEQAPGVDRAYGEQAGGGVRGFLTSSQTGWNPLEPRAKLGVVPGASGEYTSIFFQQPEI